MHYTKSSISALAALLLAGADIHTADAALITLSSPDNKWSLSSDEFGAYGIASAGSFGQRDFATGLTDYSWASSFLLAEGSVRQWLTGTDLGLSSQTLLSVANVISDVTAGSVRTSAFNIPSFANIRLDLIQTVTNSGITQEYTITNSRATAATLRLISFHDVDLDAVTAGNDIIADLGGVLKVSEGGRDVFFTPSLTGYIGYLAGLVPGGGITSNLDALAYNSFGIPAANLNQFREISGGAVGTNRDANNDKVSDIVADVGYIFQNNLSIPAGGSVTLSYRTLSVVPEPSSALLCLLGLGLTARRRRPSVPLR
jgi:hypothetical protein